VERDPILAEIRFSGVDRPKDRQAPWIRLYIPDGPVVEGLAAAVDAAWRGEGLLLCPEIAFAEIAQAEVG